MEDYENHENSFDPEDAQEVAREVFNEMSEEEIDAMFRKLEQDRVNDQRREWLEMYGFDHECSCAADVEEGRVVEVPACYAGACDEAFVALRKARGFLFAIATSPSQSPAILKALAKEAFAG